MVPKQIYLFAVVWTKALMFRISLVLSIALLTFYVNAIDYSCPIRIISNNAHSSSSIEDDPSNLLADDFESDGLLPEGGENVQPLANNTGFINIEQAMRKNFKW
jgi:hypothetical protein